VVVNAFEMDMNAARTFAPWSIGAGGKRSIARALMNLATASGP
jgi:hypothetical protein